MASGGKKRTVLRAGNLRDYPSEGSRVAVRLADRGTAEGEVGHDFVKSAQSLLQREKLSENLLFLEDTVQEMTAGEISVVALHGADLEVELIRVEKTAHLWKQTAEQHMDIASKRKNLANDFFRDSCFEAAAACYGRALQHLLLLNSPEIKDADGAAEEGKGDGKGKGLEETVESLWVSCYANLSACHLKFGQHAKDNALPYARKLHHQHALHCADKALEKDPSHVKALFRKASALSVLQEHQASRECLERLLAMEPSNAAARALLTAVNSAAKAEAASMKSALSAMFSS